MANENASSADPGAGEPSSPPVETAAAADRGGAQPTPETPTNLTRLAPRPRASRKPRAKSPATTATTRPRARAAQSRPRSATPLTALPPATGSDGHDNHNSRFRRPILDRGRDAGRSFVDSVTDAAAGVAEVQERLAETTQMPVLASAIRTQAHLTRAMSRAYARTTRQLLRL